jgi:hypothetical protein
MQSCGVVLALSGSKIPRYLIAACGRSCQEEGEKLKVVTDETGADRVDTNKEGKAGGSWQQKGRVQGRAGLLLERRASGGCGRSASAEIHAQGATPRAVEFSSWASGRCGQSLLHPLTARAPHLAGPFPAPHLIWIGISIQERRDPWKHESANRQRTAFHRHEKGAGAQRPAQRWLAAPRLTAPRPVAGCGTAHFEPPLPPSPMYHPNNLYTLECSRYDPSDVHRREESSFFDHIGGTYVYARPRCAWWFPEPVPTEAVPCT